MRKPGPKEVEHVFRNLPELIHTYWRLLNQYDFDLWWMRADELAETEQNWTRYEIFTDAMSAWIRFVGGKEKADELTAIISKEPDNLPPLTDEDIAFYREQAKMSRDIYGPVFDPHRAKFEE